MRVSAVAATYYLEGYMFDCPGCKGLHVIPVRYSPEQLQRDGGNQRPTWTFNGSLDRPTFSPSLLVTWNYNDEEHGFTEKHVCHSFIRDGQIQFLGDCTHKLSGQTVDLPERTDP